jgi:pimeloyl-ACP methyl ester carboxylesterase
LLFGHGRVPFVNSVVNPVAFAIAGALANSQAGLRIKRPQMSDITTHYWTAPDGVTLAWHEIGQGRPVMLIHGYVSDATTNWMKHAPTAAMVAEAGFRVIMPDLRAHGSSDKPHDPAHYPPDVLADDHIALIAHLDLTDFDLGGYSLGARTTARMLARGCKPGRAILSGMGLEGLTQTGNRKAFFRNILRNMGSHERGSPEWMAEAFIKTTGADAVALDLILDSFVDTPVAALAGLDLPIAVICGSEDQDNGSASALADVLPRAELITIPGNHMSAVAKPDFGKAIVAFLNR